MRRQFLKRCLGPADLKAFAAKRNRFAAAPARMRLRIGDWRVAGAGPAQIWQALHDVACLRACVPGCQSVRRASHARFDVVARVPFGPLLLPVAGHVEIIDSVPDRLLCLRGRGHGAISGRMEGTARIQIAEVVGGSRLRVDIVAESNSLFAPIGMPVAGPIARHLIDSFGASFRIALGTPAAMPSGRPIAAGRARRSPNMVWR